MIFDFGSGGFQTLGDVFSQRQRVLQLIKLFNSQTEIVYLRMFSSNVFVHSAALILPKATFATVKHFQVGVARDNVSLQLARMIKTLVTLITIVGALFQSDVLDAHVHSFDVSVHVIPFFETLLHTDCT